MTLDPNALPEDVQQSQDQQLQRRSWHDRPPHVVPKEEAKTSVYSTLFAITEEFSDKAKEAIMAAQDAAIAEIQRSRDAIIQDLHDAAHQLLAKFKRPALPPLDLDPNYTETQRKQYVADSYYWAATQFRRMLVEIDTGYQIDFSLATKKPPTPLAVALVEYYAACPKNLSSLFYQLLRTFGLNVNPEEQAVVAPPDSRPLSAGDIYLQSIGLLPKAEYHEHDPDPLP